MIFYGNTLYANLNVGATLIESCERLNVIWGCLLVAGKVRAGSLSTQPKVG